MFHENYMRGSNSTVTWSEVKMIGRKADKKHGSPVPHGFSGVVALLCAGLVTSRRTWSVRANSAFEKVMLCSKEKRTWSSRRPSLWRTKYSKT